MDETKYGFWLPPDVSAHGGQIDHLINVVHWFMAALFVGWGVYFLYCLFAFRARPGHAARYDLPKASFTKYLEAGVVVFELFLLFALSTPAWFAYKNERPDEKQALHVRLVAEQFAWNFHYPGKDGKFSKASFSNMSADNPLGLVPDDPDGRDDIVSVNQLHLPLGKPVVVDIMSKDVIHSFNIPVLRVKQDAVPGQMVPIWFTGTKAGHWEIACAQLCGLAHYRMKGDVFIDNPEDFAKWEQENAPAPPPPPEAPTAPAQPAQAGEQK
jgi:cytochrome c oxidase subunit 2